MNARLHGLHRLGEWQMDDHKLLPDLLLALTIMAAAFWLMVVVDNALSVEPEPIQYDPPCSLEYQLNIIEELRCAQPGLADD